ncbi:MAG: C45 family autoproteolytic acyltransferase/hydrolase, partial [Rudaea sp.]
DFAVTRIPVITARGTHFEVGCEIGKAAGTTIREMHAQTRAAYGTRWPKLLRDSLPFLEATEQYFPHVVQELRGASQGADVPFGDLFLMSIEELLYEEVRGEDSIDSQFSGSEQSKGCSDLAAAPPATADGNVWLAHNNDLGPRSRDDLFVTRVQADGEPEIMAVTVGGIFISIGFNSAGLSLTGDQLYANDSRVGVPRLLIVRDILAQTTFEDALTSALHPARASSYNNILASEDGRIANVEGSATDCDVMWAEGGTVFHTNHYLSDRMKKYEAAGHVVDSSSTRCSRAGYYAAHYHGSIDGEICRRFLQDHVFAPWSVCRHSGESVTVFSAIINLNQRRMWLARGNPCENDYSSYSLV